MRNFLILITLLLLAGSTACSDEKNPEQSNGIQEIKYGTSFGECLGYCRKSMVITPAEIEFTKQGWDLEGQLPDSTFNDPITTAEWNNLVESIDMDAFFALDTVIGCPDCADGGAEWIEITSEDQTYKVTFEYMDAPVEMADYIETLRDYMEQFE